MGGSAIDRCATRHPGYRKCLNAQKRNRSHWELYTWRRWDDSQPLTMPIPISQTPTGFLPNANHNNF